jgi:hypothetical protein
MTAQPQFDWQRHEAPWDAIRGRLDSWCEQNGDIRALSRDLRETAGARLIDFVDHLALSASDPVASRLREFGYARSPDRTDDVLWIHPGALLPPIVLRAGRQRSGLAVKVDRVARFLMARGFTRPIAGTPYGRLRTAEISTENGVTLWAVERRTTKGGLVSAVDEAPGYAETYLRAREQWQTRARHAGNEPGRLADLFALAETQVQNLGADLAAFLFFEVERQFFHSRSRAGQRLLNRLDAVGVGWAGHDHHTYRSSRHLFPDLVRFFETLGFEKRERFFAGAEAGWGAQVVEHPHIGVALFLDVDLAPGEFDVDFAETGLAERDDLGTVGLWCAIHGDSLLESGLHHLAVRADFDGLTEALATDRIKMMPPFSTFPYLKQAFTTGEKWAVPRARIERLRAAGRLTRAAAERFLAEGAVGSHLENIQRGDGYKGFSQTQVSSIIKDTSPENYRFD